MIFLRTVGTLLLFLISFSFMWIFIHKKIKDWQSSFLTAFIFFGTFIWFMTETLSFFKILTPLGILFIWIIYNIILLAFIIRSYEKSKIKIKMSDILLSQGVYIIPILFILFIAFIIAVLYPPNNWDSMTYHLPRIEHWLQNKTLNHYYSANIRQLLSAPFAEIVILHLRALSGDDYLNNLVQWFSLLGSIIGILKIASHLGLNKKMQIVAALFFATVPMAILQASSTQTDLVETFCIICLAERFFAWRKTGTFFESLNFGLALGLCILTKGTAYPIAFPFALCFAIISIKNFKKHFVAACVAAILCLVLNFPHYTRNYVTFHNPIGMLDGTVSDFSVKSFVVISFANINSNIFVPLPDKAINKLQRAIEKLWIILKVDNQKVFPYRQPTIQRFNRMFHEDAVKNFLHTPILIITFILFFFKFKKKDYGLIVIGSCCMFAFCIPWQPWITRLQLPLFALSATVFSLVFEDKAKTRRVFILLVTCFAILPLMSNNSRPLLTVPKITVTSDKRVWNTSREKLVFINMIDVYHTYTEAYATVVQAGVQNLGIIIGGDDWEYPLWRYIRKNSDNKIKITHVRQEMIDDNIDALFCLTPLSFLNEEVNDYSPLVLRRNLQNKSEWEILYSAKFDK